MKLRQDRVKLKCDQCNKETEWEVIDKGSGKIADITNGWILSYNVNGNKFTDSSDDTDYFSVKCLHEAVDDYFNQFNHVTNIKGGSINV